VRYTEKKQTKSYRRKKNKNVYQQIKKNQNDKGFIRHIYVRGTGACTCVCVLLRDRVLDVYIYRRTKKEATVQKHASNAQDEKS